MDMLSRVFLAFVVCLFVVSCAEEADNKSNEPLYTCEFTIDFESVEGNHYLAGDEKIVGAGSQSNHQSKSGEYSAIATEENKYAFEYKAYKLKKGQHIIFSAYQKADSSRGTIVLQGDNGLYEFAHTTVVSEDGWNSVYIDYELTKDVNELKFYGYNPYENEVYFDDVYIKISEEKEIPDYENVLSIHLDDEAYKTLKKFRKKSLSAGLIKKKYKKYVDGEITYLGKTYPAEFRLKGDWTDHLETAKWSLRVKIKDGGSVMGMKNFSIQSPHTRSFLDEWFLHQLFMHEDILTTRYHFIPVKINGKNKGLYAIEEHFTKQLVESQNRREGPIIKINEEGLWQARGLDAEGLRVPYYESAEILPFKEGHTMETPQLFAQFLDAQNLLYSMKTHQLKIDDVLNVNYTARFYALNDLVNAMHGLAWHNQRFYYNPVTAKIEQIGFDGFEEFGKRDQRRAIYGNPDSTRTPSPDAYFNLQLFNDPSFKREYVKELKRISSEDYLQEVFKKYNNAIDSLEQLISREERLYRFDRDFYKKTAEKIRGELPAYEQRDFTNDPIKMEFTPYSPNNVKDIIVDEISVKAYIQDTIDGQLKLRLLNFHPAATSIAGYSFKDAEELIIPIPNTGLKAFETQADFVEVMVPLETYRIHYHDKANPELTEQVKLVEWPYPSTENLREEFWKYSAMINKIGAKVDVDNKLFIISRSCVMHRPIVVPRGFKMIIDAGVEIDMSNASFILSYGTVEINGTEANPVKIYSSNQSGMGLLVLGAGEESIIRHCHFDNLRNFKLKHWQQTGAVVFYESDVEIDHCSFTNNHCEDALNIFRSKFKLSNSSFENTYADAFDADFCTGSIENVHFNVIGNDGVDVSGSKITLDGVHVSNARDKGISGGEGSTVVGTKVYVSKSNIGIAAKDGSYVKLTGVQIDSTTAALAAYQKKDEYEGAVLEISDYSSSYIKQRDFIEIGSQLLLDNEKIIGKQKVDIDSLYAPYK